VKRRTVVAWIGLSTALVGGIGVFLRAQQVVGANVGGEAITSGDRHTVQAGERTVSGGSERAGDERQPVTAGDPHLQRLAASSAESVTLPAPPLPSRVLPRSLPSFDQGAEDRQGRLLPTPPVPSKIMPGSSPGNVPDDSTVIDQSDRTAE
jgi:hypothetical protein